MQIRETVRNPLKIFSVIKLSTLDTEVLPNIQRWRRERRESSGTLFIPVRSDGRVPPPTLYTFLHLDFYLLVPVGSRRLGIFMHSPFTNNNILRL